MATATVTSFNGRKKVSTWARTYSSVPDNVYEPTSVEEVQAIVRSANEEGKIVRVFGSAHSPNSCAMSPDIMISLRKMNKVLDVDKQNGVVKVEAGMSLQELHEVLDSFGLAMPCIGSISEQSLAGLISTGTHGTGADYGIVATSFIELQMVLADGTVKIASHELDPQFFRAALCSFGSLGVITGVIIRAVPAFDLRAVESPTTLDAVLADIPSRVASAEFYRFWYFPHTNRVSEFRANCVAPKLYREQPLSNCPLNWPLKLYRTLRRLKNWFVNTVVGYHLYEGSLFLALGCPSLLLGINKMLAYFMFSSTTIRVDRSDRIFNFNCLFKQYVDEWAIPVDRVEEALRGLRSLIEEKRYRVHSSVEVRFVAGDDILMSTCYGRPSVYIGIIAFRPYGFDPVFRDYFYDFEKMMLSLEGRPHWAKDFHLRGVKDFSPLFPRLSEFLSIREKYDPKGVFVNKWFSETFSVPMHGKAVPDHVRVMLNDLKKSEAINAEAPLHDSFWEKRISNVGMARLATTLSNLHF